MKTFEELEIVAPLLRALNEEKYETPTPIQAQTIPHAIAGRDILGCAQTGTGKTAAFALPILNRLAKRNRKAVPRRPRSLILAPTRELAVQIGESIATYGRHLHLRHTLIYGGVSQVKQVRALNRGTHIAIATPGRLIDLMNQGHVQLDGLELFVLDEADRMMDMGFLPDVKRIIKQLPQQRQSLFFSATMPPKVVELSQQLLHDAVNIDVTPKTTSVKSIEQRVLFVERGGKQSQLQKLLGSAGVERTLVFTRTKHGADVVARKLERGGISAIAIHGNKSQNARQKALDAFRNNRVRVLVATDVASRGIDVDGVTHVVNFDMPVEPESYVHRIGRTGRAGAAGVALSFCTSNEYSELRSIETLIGEELPVDPDSGQPTKHRGTSGKPGQHGYKANRKKSPPKPTRRRKANSQSASRQEGQASATSSNNGKKRKWRRKKRTTPA